MVKTLINEKMIEGLAAVATTGDYDDLTANKPTTITTAQANEITANTAKISFDSTSSTRLLNTSGTNTGDQDLSGYQPLDSVLTGTTASFTTALSSEISANTLKVSFDSTSSTRLADTSGTNTGDNAINTLYSSLVSYPGSADATELNILDGATLTTVELNYVDGVTSSIQTQLNSKLGLSGGTMTGDIAMGNNSITGIEAPTYNGEVTDTYLATKTIDFSSGSRRVITLTGNSTITFSAGGIGTSILRVVQDTTGSRVITFANLKSGLTAPELLTGASEETLLIVVKDGDGDYWVSSLKLE